MGSHLYLRLSPMWPTSENWSVVISLTAWKVHMEAEYQCFVSLAMPRRTRLPSPLPAGIWTPECAELDPPRHDDPWDCHRTAAPLTPPNPPQCRHIWHTLAVPWSVWTSLPQCLLICTTNFTDVSAELPANSHQPRTSPRTELDARHVAGRWSTPPTAACDSRGPAAKNAL